MDQDHRRNRPRLLARASASRCALCPTDRVCAWDCVQGAGAEDIVIGAVLEQSRGWALTPHDPGTQAVQAALWALYNA
jgi:hypothetical protein